MTILVVSAPMDIHSDGVARLCLVWKKNRVKTETSSDGAPGPVHDDRGQDEATAEAPGLRGTVGARGGLSRTDLFFSRDTVGFTDRKLTSLGRAGVQQAARAQDPAHGTRGEGEARHRAGTVVSLRLPCYLAFSGRRESVRKEESLESNTVLQITRPTHILTV